MESKEWLRGACFGNLRFLGLDSTTESLETWRKRISEYIRETAKHIKFDLSEYSNIDLPRRVILAQLSVLAILVSREFDAALEAVVAGEWEQFDLLFESEKKQCEAAGGDWHDFRTREVFLWCRHLSRWAEETSEGMNEPVREIEPWEKRLWCEEIARSLPQTSAPFEQKEGAHSFKRFRGRYKEARRLHLSIDPFTPVEIVTEKVAEIVKRYQEEASKEHIDSFQHEIEQNVPGINADIVQLWDREERLNYDDIRNAKGVTHSKLKDKANEFFTWLKIYHLKRRKYSPIEIAKETNSPKDWAAHLKENKIDALRREHNKKNKRAQKLIQAALQGKSPLTASIT